MKHRFLGVFLSLGAKILAVKKNDRFFLPQSWIYMYKWINWRNKIDMLHGAVSRYHTFWWILPFFQNLEARKIWEAIRVPIETRILVSGSLDQNRDETETLARLSVSIVSLRPRDFQFSWLINSSWSIEWRYNACYEMIKRLIPAGRRINIFDW